MFQNEKSSWWEITTDIVLYKSAIVDYYLIASNFYFIKMFWRIDFHSVGFYQIIHS